MINNFKTVISAAIVTVLVLVSCKQKGDVDDIAFAKASATESIPQNVPKREVSQEFKDYWYTGAAEISSYKLEQARYGEMRDGNAVLIFVTEDFNPEKQVKADSQNENNIPVLKLNATKNFTTGIYPYSVMNSTFYPVFNKQHAIKVSSSMQEWCGHVYAQLNNKDNYEIMSHSYFESEADQDYTLDKDILENELWTQLRINPLELPVGDIKVIPDFSYTRMKHIEVKGYKAVATLTKSSYALEYPVLNRTLVLNFDSKFPHTITSWEETYKDGYGANAQELTTKATRIKTIKSPYWGKNSNKDASLREELGLD